MTILDSILKSRDVTLSAKVCLVKAVIFPVVMYGCQIWTIKKAQPWRMDVFKWWCWKRLLRIPWSARRSNQSILKKMNPEYSLEELMLMLKPNTLATRCEEPTLWKRSWCWERLKSGEEDDREWEGWMHNRFNGHWFSKLWEMVKDREACYGSVHWGCKVLDTTEQLNNKNNRPIKW